jgi:hypothetical protein
MAPPVATPAAQPSIPPPAARPCFECRPGEQALWVEARLPGGGAGCPADLAQRLSAAPLAELQAVAAAAPAGCAVLRVDLRNVRYTGFRYEAAGEKGAEDCFPGRPCPAGECRFVGEPVLRRDGDRTIVLALFESTGAAPRTGALTVYGSTAKRR